MHFETFALLASLKVFRKLIIQKQETLVNKDGKQGCTDNDIYLYMLVLSYRSGNTIKSSLYFVCYTKGK